MDNCQLNRVMNLIRRTGDRCVVLDNENSDAMVVMDLDEYERMLDDDERPCSCCVEDKDLEEEDDLMADHEPEEVSAEEKIDDFSSKVRDLHEEIFANIGTEVKLGEVPVAEEERFYLEPIDE